MFEYFRKKTVKLEEKMDLVQFIHNNNRGWRRWDGRRRGRACQR